MWDPYAEFQSAKLPNGLTVHAAHWPGRPWEAMGFLIHSGAEYDPVGLEGLSHFIEHVVSENANVSKKEMEAFFEDCGGMVNLGTTGYPYTHYRFFVPTDKAVLAKAFSMFGHMLLSAKLEKFIERERQVIIAEFHRHYPVKFKLDLDVREHKALYTGYWLERFVRPLGNPESVTRITQSELQSHYDAHYTPANMSIVGVGGMQLPELIELLSESPFTAQKKGGRTPLPTPATDVAPPSETRHVFEVSKHLTMPIEVCAYRSVAKIPGNINGRVIRIMKEMFNEVLFEEVRERRAWAYAIDSSRYNFRHFYEFSINCGALALKAIDDIEEVIEVCIASMADREDLFEQAKRRALASNFMTDPTGKGICDGALNDLAEDQRIMSLKELGDDLEHVTMSDVRGALQWLRPDRRWTLITRP
ncbi:hypothetical protein A2661_02630 [Candidatus Giovannonibacteria bacterium RIFCSPHIGHO2_01_FULL_45_24]|nr:MAG: hypothetical protein A2661_02630 [Candidatus Giovannonibacteria bacterium RIFCSPHIGHO2_01_FULL_45_24]